MIDIHIGNRSDAINLLSDLFELAEAGLLELDNLIDALTALKDAIEREVI